jgi:hypothetical protein
LYPTATPRPTWSTHHQKKSFNARNACSMAVIDTSPIEG